jgi:hypothetical protein
MLGYIAGTSKIYFHSLDQGLATRSVLVALPFGAIAELSRRIVDARRPFEMTQEMREEMIIPYMPEIPMATEDLISHNQTILGVRGIKTAYLLFKLILKN